LLQIDNNDDNSVLIIVTILFVSSCCVFYQNHHPDGIVEKNSFKFIDKRSLSKTEENSCATLFRFNEFFS